MGYQVTSLGISVLATNTEVAWLRDVVESLHPVPAAWAGVAK